MLAKGGILVARYRRLRDLREDRDLTQKALAEKLFMQTTQYRRYESGERPIALETAIELANFYDVSLDYIAGLTDHNNKIESKDLDSEEKLLITLYRKLNATDKKRIIERAMALSEK